ncbi:carotenoid ester lipase precursor [Flagelloscypha sp. PMI_526]|nr:carotenoid ester lipase precursor [Flagelloscypha sp. PMI_526]
MRFFASLLLYSLLSVSAVTLQERADPTVTLDTATVTGFNLGDTSNYYGIPFAQPPTGDRRFRLPEPHPAYQGAITAKAFGPSCPQQAFDLPLPKGLVDSTIDWLLNTAYLAILPDDEDCLTINIVTPKGVKPGAKLPVAAWIFGGGFELGGVQYYPGGTIVDKSIDLGTPVVYVSFNYRVSGFGFMPGKEIKDAGVGNLGLHDQREALRWIQKYISNFGGDPQKVTIFGESAGAISISLQMLYNGGDTEGLYRAAFMMSGSPIPTGDITHGQVYYDDVVSRTGCAGKADTLQCLREVPYKTLKDAINLTPGIFAYQSLALAYLPRTDGVFVKEDAQKLVGKGLVANVPIVNGDKDDEGTLFMLSTLNITTDAQLKDYIRTYWLPSGTDDQLNTLLSYYPNAIEGSPYGTLLLNQLSSRNKQIASLIGDAVFQGPRRYFLEQRVGKQPIWTYNNKKNKLLPFLGAAHATDILDIYGESDLTEYFIQFCVSLDPNTGKAGLRNWPQYDLTNRKMLEINDWPLGLTMGADTYRKEPLKYLTGLLLANPI